MNKAYNKVVVLGLGGTGSILAPLLCRYLMSQQFDGRIVFIDGDTYAESNLSRQIFALGHIGLNKAEYQATVISSHLPSLAGQLEIVDKYIGVDDVELLVEEGTIVINCSDNKAARKIIEDRINQLDTAVHICCGNELTSGQVQVCSRKNGVHITPSIYERSPVFNSLDDDRSIMSCEEMAALPSGGQLITANATAAVLALNMFVQCISDEMLYLGGEWLPNDMIKFNTKHNVFVPEGQKQPDFERMAKYNETNGLQQTGRMAVRA